MIKEMLIKTVDAHHPDLNVDTAGCYKKGDIVCIMPEGHEWGRLECLPRFLVVKADLTDKEADELVSPVKSYLLNTDGGMIIKARRKYKFDFEKNMGVEKLKAVRESGWRVEGIEKNWIELKP